MPSRHPEQYKEMLARLRQARLNAGLRQDDVARHLGVRQNLVSKMELGERRLDPIELAELVDLYEVTLEEIVRGDPRVLEPPDSESDESNVSESQPPVGPITSLLFDWKAGDEDALRAVMPLVYDDLKAQCRRRLAGDHSVLQPTELVSEAYLRFAQREAPLFESRKTFFAYSALVIRSVLIDQHRQKNSGKRGGDAERLTLSTDIGEISSGTLKFELGRLLEKLEEQGDHRMVRTIEFKLFAGLTENEIAETLAVSRATVQREWNLAKRLLISELGL